MLKSNGSLDHEGSVSTRSAAEGTTTEGTSVTDEIGWNADVLNDLEGLRFDSNSSASDGSGANTPFASSSGGLDTLDVKGKEKALASIFPQLKAFDVKWTLKKCNYDVGKAIEELMTQSFLDESRGRQRGVEAFLEEEGDVKKKKKGKRKEMAQENVFAHVGNGLKEREDKQTNQWDTGRMDIDFLCRITGMPTQQIGSLYHEHGASVQATIRSLIDRHIEIGLEDDDDAVLQLQAHQLKADHPTLSQAEIKALIQITHFSTANASSLAEALTTRQTNNSKGAIRIEFRHVPPDLATDETSTPLKHPKLLPSELDYLSASNAAQSLHFARLQASTQAASAYRKSRSSPLYGGAASYYSQVSRDLAHRAKTMDSIAADALVSSQSTSQQLDLHGVSVKDAVRISREAVTQWWVRESEERLREGKKWEQIQGGFRIVTGVGKHSEGGRGKIGPAVGGMLVREGWKVEIGSGVIVVQGIAKK